MTQGDFYASGVCGVCQNWSGYGNPLCEDCSNRMYPLQELCNNCGRILPTIEINHAGLCAACQQRMSVAERVSNDRQIW